MTRWTVALVAALASMSWARRAEADDWTGGLGAFVGFAFGAHEGIQWGLEAFAMRRFSYERCSDRPRSAAGPLLQLAWMGARNARVTVALQAGREFQQGTSAVTGELGATYRVGADAGYGLHLGVTPELWLLNTSLRGELFLDDYSAASGIRFLPTYGLPDSCSTASFLGLSAD
jgi:hypothetical protein